MGSHLGKRVISFLNLPIKLLLPTTNLNNITEIAIKTIPSASKIEIKRVLESLYGFDVLKVQTLNMEGKKKKRGGTVYYRPDYKKAYVTLRNSLSISPDWFPLGVIEEEKKNKEKQQALSKSKSTTVVDGGEVSSHWLDDDRDDNPLGLGKGSRWQGRQSVQGGNRFIGGFSKVRWVARGRGGGDKGGGGAGQGEASDVKFPWSNMRPGR